MHPVIAAQDHLSLSLDKLHFIGESAAFIYPGHGMDEKTISGLSYSLESIREDITAAMAALDSFKVGTAS